MPGAAALQSRGERVARNAALLSAGQVSARALQTVWLLFLARHLGAERYGVYTLAISFVGFVSIVSDLGVGLIVLRQSAQNPDQAPGLMAAGLRLVSVLSLAAVALAVGLTLALGYRGEILLISTVSAASIFPNAFFSLASVVFQTHERFGLVAAFTLVNLVMGIAFGAVALVLGAGVLGLAVAIVVAAAVNAVASWTVALRFVRPSFGGGRRLARPLLVAALPLGLAAYAQTAAFRVDNLLIAHALGVKILAYYGLAFMFYSSAVELFFTPLIGVTFPLMSRVAQESADELRRVLRRTFGLVLVILLPLAAGAFILAEPIIRFGLGPSYRPAAPVLRILILALVPTAYWGTLTKAMIVRRRHGAYIATFLALLGFVATGVSVGLRVHGVTGAAAGVLCAHVATSLLAALLMREYAWIVDVSRTLKVLAATAAMAGVAWSLRHQPVLLAVGAGAAVYGLTALLIGVLDSYDRRALVDGLWGPIGRLVSSPRTR